MTTIAILGANGQVGSEVCLTLSLMPDVTVVPVCRTELASSLLRRCGLACRHGSLADPARAAELLAGCDLVADFSLPKGLASNIRSATHEIVSGAIRAAPPHARIVYASSLMAFGMGTRRDTLREHLVARTVYGATKRYGEHLARVEGARSGREVYVLRLGDVHGELQSITRGLRASIDDRPARVPEGESYTVFVSTIAEALVSIASGKQEPGTYSLIAAPSYTWSELYEHYAREQGRVPVVHIAEASSSRGAMRAWGHALSSPLVQQVIENRDVLTAHVLSRIPGAELRAKAAHLRRRARAEIGTSLAVDEQVPFSAFRGLTVPGRRLNGLSDPRESMPPMAARVRSLLARCAP